MSIPQPLVLLLPLVVTTLSGWLSHDKFPEWLNALISGIIVLLCAAAWALTSKSLASDLVADLVLIASYCAALMAGPLKPLQSYLEMHWMSPLALALPSARIVDATPAAPKSPQGVISQGMASNAMPTPPAVRPRASALEPGQSWVLKDPVKPASVPSNPTPPMRVEIAESPENTQDGSGHSA